MGTSLYIWYENIGLLSSLCDKEGIVWSTRMGAKDCDGDMIYTFHMERSLSRKSQLEYQEKRVRKEFV
jgi:hypothetical protein